MKPVILICLFISLSVNFCYVAAEEKCVYGEKADGFPFYVYTEADSLLNKFLATGYMGDYNDLKVNQFSRENPYAGLTCVKIVYTGEARQGGRWAGLFWQYPGNNWGDKPGGYDLRGAKRLTFWARGQKGGEVINSFQFGGIEGRFPDSGMKAIGPVTLTREWQKYTLDLRDMASSINYDKNSPCPAMGHLARIIGGFSFATNIDVNQEKIIFYLDEIRFEKG